MFIECPNCNKKFDVDQNLIPDNGRLVQCGSCEHTWVYKKKLHIEKVVKNDLMEEKVVKKFQDEIILSKKEKKKEIPVKSQKIGEKKYEIIKKVAEPKDTTVNYFKLLIVMFISFVALIVILDTFKLYISNFFPNISVILDNLYETLIDLFLFFKDLIK